MPAGVQWSGAGRWVAKGGDGTAAAGRRVEWLADGMGGGLLAVGKDRDDGGVRAVDEIGTMLEQVLTRVRQVQELLFHTRVIPHLTAHPMHCGPAVSAVWHVSRLLLSATKRRVVRNHTTPIYPLWSNCTACMSCTPHVQHGTRHPKYSGTKLHLGRAAGPSTAVAALPCTAQST